MGSAIPKALLIVSLLAATSIVALAAQTPSEPPRDREAARAGNDQAPAREAVRARREAARESGRRRGPRLASDDLQQAVALVVMMHPDLKESMQKHLEENPQRLHQMIEQRFPRVVGLLAIREREPQLFAMRVRELQINARIEQLMNRYRQASGQDQARARPAMREQLMPLLQERFELREHMREQRIAALERYMQRLREQAREEQQQREALLDQEFEQLLAPPETAADTREP